jgi:hypothetical protein
MQAIYAVIRYIPSILREEFVNVGVILVCPEAAYQGVLALPSFNKDQRRLSALENTDGHFVQHAITKLSNAATNRTFHELVGRDSAPEGLLTAPGLSNLQRSYHNNIQLTKPRTALTESPQATLEQLYRTFVAELEAEAPRRTITREKMRAEVTKVFNRFDLFSRYPNRVKEKVQPVPGTTKVDIYYQNGVAHFYQVIPFVDPGRAATAASSYRMVAADVHSYVDVPEFAEAKFAVFGYYGASQEHSVEIGDVRARLENDGIELLDYRHDALNVAEQIRRELDDMHGAALPAD